MLGLSGVEGLILYGMFADSGYCLSPLVAVLCLALKIGIINNTVLSAAYIASHPQTGLWLQTPRRPVPPSAI